VITDKNGRYHIPAIKPGRHVLRLDESTLPEGAYLTTDKAVIVDITNGLLTKVNFGVNKSEAEASSPIRIIRKKDTVKPLLNISLYPEIIVLPKDGLSKADILDKHSPETYLFEVSPRTYEFRIFTNYPLFIEKWRIEILDKDTKEIVKIFRGDAF